MGRICKRGTVPFKRGGEEALGRGLGKALLPTHPQGSSAHLGALGFPADNFGLWGLGCSIEKREL